MSHMLLATLWGVLAKTCLGDAVAALEGKKLELALDILVHSLTRMY